MVKHKFTKEDCRKGGWERARYWANWRKSNPSLSEARARLFLVNRGIAFEAEFEINHETGMPQFFDLFIPAQKIAVEVDGSHGWHDYNGSYDKNLKMSVLDEMKARYCQENGIRLICIRKPEELETIFPKES